MSFNVLGRLALLVLFVWSLAACGNTWSGMKEDTGQNMESVGESMDQTGDELQEEAK